MHLKEREIEKSQYQALARLRKWFGFGKKSVFQSISITQGFFLAAIVHGIFNYLLHLGMILFAAIFVGALSILIVYLLNLESTQIQYGLVGTEELPEEDFEKLRMQISVLQHMKDIQKAHGATVQPSLTGEKVKGGGIYKEEAPKKPPSDSDSVNPEELPPTERTSRATVP